MRLGPVLFVVEDRPHAEIMFFGTERVFHFRKLDVGVPQRLRIALHPVGAQDVAAAVVKRPLVALFVLSHYYGKLFVASFGDVHSKEGRRPAVLFQKTTDPTLDLLAIL